MWNQFSFINKRTSMYNTYFLTQKVCLPGKHNMIKENTTNDNNKLISKGATTTTTTIVQLHQHIRDIHVQYLPFLHN